MKLVTALYTVFLISTFPAPPVPSDVSGRASHRSNTSWEHRDGTTYYVSSSTGSDDNVGTREDAPFATLGHAFRVAGRSDTVLLKRGDVFEPHAHPNYAVDLRGARGTKLARFVIGAYGPEKDGRPQIEGGVASSSLSWKREAAGIWYAPAPTDDAGLVWYDGDGAGGDHGKPFARVATKNRLVSYPGTAYYDRRTGRAYVHLPDSLRGNPATLPLRIAGADAGFYILGTNDYLTIREIKVSHVNSGIKLNDGQNDYARIEDVHVAGCGYYGLYADNTYGLEVIGGIYEGCHNGEAPGGGSGGVHVVSPRESIALVEGVLVRDNGSLDLNRAIDSTSYVLNWAGGVEFGNGAGGVARYNTCLAREGTYGAVCYNAEGTGARSVVFHGNVAVGGRWGGYATHASNVTFEHNTFIGWGGDALDETDVLQSAGIALGNKASNITIRNNILASDYDGPFEAAPLTHNGSSVPGLVADHNLLWLSSHPGRIVNRSTFLGRNYQTLAAWQAAGYGTGSVVGPPLLADLARGNYAPAHGSPAVELAKRSTYTPPFDGAAPDVGAVQTSLRRNAAIPARPAGVDAASVGSSGFTLTWSDDTNEGTYAVLYLDDTAVDSFVTSPYTFTSLLGNTTYEAGVQFVNAMGNRSGIATLRVTTDEDAAGAYLSKALSYGPVAYWPLDDGAGSTTVRSVLDPRLGGTVRGAVDFGRGGIGDGRTAARFSGDAGGGRVVLPAGALERVLDKDTGTLMLWFKATSASWTDGVDRKAVYLYGTPLNRVYIHQRGDEKMGGAYVGGGYRQHYNVVGNEAWHHVAITWDAAGSEVKHYLDGVLTRTQTDVTAWESRQALEAAYLGSAGKTQYWSGHLAHVALFDRPLDAQEVAALAERGTSGSNRPPVASFSTSIEGLTVTFKDHSNDPEGKRLTYAWDFGDGESSTLRHPVHTFASPGTYRVSLTVKDGSGVTDVHATRLSLRARHAILLRKGWQVISSPVMPSDPDLEAIFGDVADDVVLVEDQLGQRFIPGRGLNRIGTWSPSQAYKVYAASSDTLHIEGDATLTPSRPLPLDKGWNLVPYLLGEEVDVEVALGSILGNLVLIKDYHGRVYAPAHGISQLKRLKPGQGYQLYVSNPDTLVTGRPR